MTNQTPIEIAKYLKEGVESGEYNVVRDAVVRLLTSIEEEMEIKKENWKYVGSSCNQCGFFAPSCAPHKCEIKNEVLSQCQEIIKGVKEALK